MVRVATAAACAALLAACAYDWDGYDPRKARTSTATTTTQEGGGGGAGGQGGAIAQGGDGAASACGDGSLDGDEQCDDGGTASGDGCSADCMMECDTLFDDGTFHCYVFLDELATDWDGARTACLALGSGFDLVGISSAAEHSFLIAQSEIAGALLPDVNTAVIWLGGTDADLEGQWLWVNGEDFHPQWVTGEPNNGGTGEDCTVYLQRAGVIGYDDRDCARTGFPALCERAPAGR